MLFRPVINLGLALTGAAAIMAVNTQAPADGVPCGATAKACAVACDKSGDCVQCPNGTWCCKDKNGETRCCRMDENGKCVPCPPGDCKPGDCAPCCKDGAPCPKDGPCREGAKSPCASMTGKAVRCSGASGGCGRTASAK